VLDMGDEADNWAHMAVSRDGNGYVPDG
jgi:hypothetical protein